MSRQWTILLLVIAMPIAAATPQVHHYVTIGVEGGALHVNKQYWGAEASFGGGYALERNHFMLALSLQAGYQYASARQTDYATHEPAIDDENKPYILNSIYTNGKAQYHMVNIALPILFGGASEHFYGLVGPVIGMQVYGKESNQYSLTTTGDYDPMIETFHDMPNHGFYTRDTHSQKQLNNTYSVKAMVELIPGTTDGPAEKHVPVIKVSGNTVSVTVGAKIHPSETEHYIEWILLQTDKGIQQKWLDPGNSPNVDFAIMSGEKVEAAFEYCNIHKLWKADYKKPAVCIKKSCV